LNNIRLIPVYINVHTFNKHDIIPHYTYRSYIMARVEFIGQIQPIAQAPFEIVERKGIGHPDTLADGAAESGANAYAKSCLANFGIILRHALDKASIRGGSIDVDFGRGEVLLPATLSLGGHVSTRFGATEFGAYETITSAAKAHIFNTLPNLKTHYLTVERHTDDREPRPYWHHPRDISDVPDAVNPRSNDTSTTVGTWPLSETEKLALGLEGFFYQLDGQPRFPYVGQDIKVMAKRLGEEITVTMAVPLLGTYVQNREEYLDILDTLERQTDEYAQTVIGNKSKVQIRINPAREPGQEYLLHIGSCIESAEDGFVGRGNKGHGVISTARPISVEAPHGKNPLSFSGKVHSLLATELARILSENHENADVDVCISTNMGDPILEPDLIAIRASKPLRPTALRSAIQQMKELDYLKMILNGYFLPKVTHFDGNTLSTIEMGAQ
jgi:S-adenosylmethionine synthetase